MTRDRLRDYGRDAIFGPEPEIDPIATEREIEELQQERLKRLRRPTFDPEPVEPEDYESRPYQGEWVDKPKYKIYRSKSGEVLGYQEDGIELDADGNPRKTIKYDHNEDSWLLSRAGTGGDEEPDYHTQTDRERVDNWLKTGSFPSTEGFPGWDKVGGVAGEIAGEKIALAREKLGEARERVGDTIEHLDDRRLLSYGVSPDLLSAYRAWQEKYDDARENGDDVVAKAAYRELRATKYQIDSQVEHYRQLQAERRAKAADLKRREQGVGRAGYTTGGRSGGRPSGRSGISDKGLENRMLPKKNPANVSLFPERRRGSNLTVDVRRNQNVDLSVRGNPGAISPVVRRSGAVAGAVPPLSGGVSPLVQRRTQYTPTLHRPQYQPPRIGQSFPAPIPRQARAPVPQSTTPRFQFPTVKSAGFFSGVIGGNVVNSIQKNFALPNRHGTVTQTPFKRRHETSPTKSTSKIVENINALAGNSHEKRRGARISIGAPNINIPTIDPSRFGNVVTPRKVGKKATDIRKEGREKKSATSKKTKSSINANLADLAGITIRRVRR